MRLDFNVLWVEDQRDRVRAQHERIATIIRKEGFQLVAQFAPSVAEAKRYISDELYADHVDLILMDYDLGPGPKGDKGIQETREVMPYKEIVFYSAQADLRAILQASGSKADGVYISSREDLPSNVTGIFQMLVKKVLDIEHSRGIVMGATSEIDHLVNDCLSAYYDNCSPDIQAGIISLVVERSADIKKRIDADLEKLAAVKHVSDLEVLHSIYTSADRLRLLRKIFESLKLHSDKNEKLVAYSEKVIPRRNDMAHVRVHVEGFSRKLFDRSKKEFTTEDMRNLRLLLLEARELFEHLRLNVKK